MKSARVCSEQCSSLCCSLWLREVCVCPAVPWPCHVIVLWQQKRAKLESVNMEAVQDMGDTVLWIGARLLGLHWMDDRFTSHPDALYDLPVRHLANQSSPPALRSCPQIETTKMTCTCETDDHFVGCSCCSWSC